MEEENLNEEEKEQELADNTMNDSRHGFAKGFVSGVIICVIAFAAILIVFMRSSGTGIFSSGILNAKTREKINTIATYIEDEYYEEVDEDTIRNGMYKGMLEILDDYSTYYTAEEYEQMYESSISGTYSGIGALVGKDSDTGSYKVLYVYDGSPASEGGLLTGDVLISADEYLAEDMDLTEFVSHIRGEDGTTVSLVIERDGEEMTLELTRRELEYQYVDYEMLEDGGNKIGYVRVTEFAGSAADQFAEAIDELEADGMDALIVDLRDNPGGVLTTVCTMLDRILPEGTLVSTKDKNGEGETIYSDDEEYIEVPIAVVVNGNSASASEIFAGAMKDRGAGTIVGTTTFGKGVVQTLRKMSDDSAFKLTTSSYYTPSGVCIQGTGIEPDVSVEYEYSGAEDEETDLMLDSQVKASVEALEGVLEEAK